MSSHPPLTSNHQKSSSSSSPSSAASLTVGIVGFGSFAQFLVKTILKQGHTVTATSRSDYTLLCNRIGVSFFREVDRFLEADNDVIMVCTSILSFQGVIHSMPFHLLRKPTLFVDALSVKEHPKHLLIKAVPEDADLLCTHPMFGPESGKDGWQGLPFMFEKGCRMLEMTCEEHDRLAARSQFLSHTIGRTLAEMDIESTPINTKSFQALIQLKESTVGDSFDLFKGLFVYNRFAKDELDNLEKALGSVKNRLQEQETAENL
ncbi:hypothetical protein V2J09_012540 [Rumex salicifolius]